MNRYDSISHLVRSLGVKPDFVEVEFHSDCGRFQQTVTVARAQDDQADSGVNLGGWLRNRLKSMLSTKRTDLELNQADKRRLVVTAFQEIEPRLIEHQGKWVRATAEEHPVEQFENQLKEHPVVDKYDREVLIRVLLEVSRSDSEVREEERALLHEIVTDEGVIRRFSMAPPITTAELAEASSVPVKETILMLAWAMAYADGYLDPEEKLHLNQLCRGFMLPEKRVRELQLIVKLFLLDRYFHHLKENLSGPELRRAFTDRLTEWGLDSGRSDIIQKWLPLESDPLTTE